MKLETFFEKFEQFADAPNSVAKMRELVLRLAFTGGLTGNQIDDEGLPVGWKKRTVESISSFITPGFACSRSHQVKGGHVHLRTHNISTLGKLNFDLLVRIDPKMINPEKASICRGDILFNNTNSQELVGKSCIVDHDYPYGFSNHINRICLKEDIDSAFVVFYLTLLRNSGHFARLCTRWINQAAINTDTLKKQIIPIPPLAEQRRIVSKVDELMALCDRLETQQQERDARHAALAHASLARFADAPTPASLNFLFHPSYAISPTDLRKTILTLAVQGKLVQQDVNDEPADQLIVRLGNDRERIAKEKGLQLPKNVPDVDIDNIPHEIPESWQWERIGRLAMLLDYGTSQKSDSNSANVPVYRMGNIVGGKLCEKNLKYVESTINGLPELYLKTDDILFNRTNSYELVGKCGIFKGHSDYSTFASYLIRIRLPKAHLYPSFFNLAMNAPYFRQTQIEPEITQQCGQANFNGTKLASTLVPVPPIAEQRRIVAKVDQLMALVDQLEAQLADSRTAAINLMEAVVAELTLQGVKHADI